MSYFDLNIGAELHHHQELNKRLEEYKLNNKNFSVIDIGGGCCSHFWKDTDVILDWNTPNCNIYPDRNPYTKHNIKHIYGNIVGDPDGWNEVLSYVQENGKFDFAICNNVLEDVPSPDYVAKMIPRIAKSGYVSVPSKESELRRGYHSSLPYFRGSGHHYWIFVVYKDKIIGLPKLNWLDYISDEMIPNIDPSLGGAGMRNPHTNKMIPLPKQELSFYWKEDFDIVLASPFEFKNLPTGYAELHPELAEAYKENDQPWFAFTFLLNKSL